MLLTLNPLVSPDAGLFIWSTIAFVMLFGLLSKFAWKPIVKALDERERSIEDALSKAEMAKEELNKLTNENEQLLKEARAERDEILKEAKVLKDKIVHEAKALAQTESVRMIEKARVEINIQKTAALDDIKNQVATLSIDIASKILHKQFEDHNKQQALVSDLLERVELN